MVDITNSDCFNDKNAREDFCKFSRSSLMSTAREERAAGHDESAEACVHGAWGMHRDLMFIRTGR